MRVLRRPMFRGSVPQRNEGIMDGLVNRKGHAFGSDNPYAKEAYEAFSQIDRPRDTSLAEMLVGGGLNLMSGQGAGDGLMSNVAKSYKGPSEQYFKSSRAAGDYDRKLQQAAVQSGLEQKWTLEQIKAKSNPQTALYNVYLEQGVEGGMSGTEAQRYATYHTTTKEELRQKVGGNRVGGILEFDLNDEKQKKKQLPKLKKDIGKYFYDPYDGKIKLLTEQNGVLGFVEFNSVADITFGNLPEGVSTETSTPYQDTQVARELEKQEGNILDEDVATIRGY